MNKLTFDFYHRSFATIDLSAIKSNFLNLKSLLEDNVLACSVIKANAYGHGANEVAHYLEGLTDYFAVATIEEAIDLRKNKIQKPILILGYTDPSQYDDLIKFNLETTIYNVEEAKKLSSAAKRCGVSAKAHIAVDTGMGRIGFAPTAEGADSVKEIARLEHLEIVGLFSHYAKADYQNKSLAMKQTELFDNFIALLEERGVSIPIKHICNSAGSMELKKHYNMARFGIALYGLYPSDEVEKSTAFLVPAMSVYSHVVHVKYIQKGDGIGYGHEYIANSKRKIATVAIGYADGFNRCLTNVGYVLISGKRAPVCGKVCMDQIMVDVSDIEDIEVGDVAVIIGKYGDEMISAEEFGNLCHSFNYEVACTFMPRVKRYYIENDKIKID